MPVVRPWRRRWRLDHAFACLARRRPRWFTCSAENPGLDSPPDHHCSNWSQEERWPLPRPLRRPRGARRPGRRAERREQPPDSPPPRTARTPSRRSSRRSWQRLRLQRAGGDERPHGAAHHRGGLRARRRGTSSRAASASSPPTTAWTASSRASSRHSAHDSSSPGTISPPTGQRVRPDRVPQRPHLLRQRAPDASARPA